MKYKRVATLAILVGCLLAVGITGIAAAEESRTGNFTGTFDPYASENVTVGNGELVLGEEVTGASLGVRSQQDVAPTATMDYTMTIENGDGESETIRVYVYIVNKKGGEYREGYVEHGGTQYLLNQADGSRMVGFGTTREYVDIFSDSNYQNSAPTLGNLGANMTITSISDSIDLPGEDNGIAVQTTPQDQGTYTERYPVDDAQNITLSDTSEGTGITSDAYYESGYVYVEYTLTDESDSVDEYTVTWDEAGTVEIVNLETEDPLAGETATISANIQNPGDTAVSQNLLLTVDGEEVDSTNVTLDSGESKTVPLEWTTTLDDVGSTHDVEVSSENDSATGLMFVEEAPPDFDISGFDPATDVVEGDPITTEVTVENLGQVEGTQDITLEVGGSQVDATDVTLAGGESTTVTLEWQTQDVDGGQTYTMTASSDNSSVSSETYIVGQAHFDVSGVTGDTVLVGETMNVDAMITNTGENEVTQSVVLEADGDQVDSTTVTLAEGESTNVTFGWEPATGGTSYDLAVRSDDDSGTDLAYVEESGAIEIETVDIENGVEETIWPVSVDLVNPGDTDVTENVSFEIDGSQMDSTEVTLEGGESATVDFEWQPDEAGEYTATFTTADDERNETVTVLSESAFNVVIKEPPEEIVAGDSVSVRVDVINTGETADTQNLTYSFNGTEVATRQIQLEGDSYETVHFDLEADEPGEYQYTVSSEDDWDEANVTVLAEGNLRIADVDTLETVDNGENATANVTFENVGGVATTETAQLYVDGDLVDDREVTEGTVSFDLPTDGSGEYNYTIEVATDSTEFSVTVTESGGLLPTDNGRSWVMYVAFGLAGIGGLVGVIAYRRR